MYLKYTSRPANKLKTQYPKRQKPNPKHLLQAPAETQKKAGPISGPAFLSTLSIFLNSYISADQQYLINAPGRCQSTSPTNPCRRLHHRQIHALCLHHRQIHALCLHHRHDDPAVVRKYAAQSRHAHDDEVLDTGLLHKHISEFLGTDQVVAMRDNDPCLLRCTLDG